MWTQKVSFMCDYFNGLSNSYKNTVFKMYKSMGFNTLEVIWRTKINAP